MLLVKKHDALQVQYVQLRIEVKKPPEIVYACWEQGGIHIKQKQVNRPSFVFEKIT